MLAEQFHNKPHRITTENDTPLESYTDLVVASAKLPETKSGMDVRMTECSRQGFYRRLHFRRFRFR